ncbi:hypothetical protein ANO11243_040100 [Dothideomycetidae sp. 11243]|nr:hypothetical protein ANO11243_040100 [fungal sp. No.11243]
MLRARRQTIDTFQAASTFLELLIIWGPLEAETSQKIKYAKYHALRIAKALKAGEDPNASNPKDDLASPTVATGASGDHAMPFQPDLSSPPPAAYQPPTVEDESERTAPPITAPSANMTSDAPEVETAGTSRTVETSQDADYFPPVPTFTSESTASATTTANPDTVMSDPTDFYAQQPTQPPQPALISPPVQQPAVMQPPIPSPHPMPQATVPVHQATLPPSAAAYRTDDESVALAQKHSRWAISALNFEDVPTAVKELRLALQYLGAS